MWFPRHWWVWRHILMYTRGNLVPRRISYIEHSKKNVRNFFSGSFISSTFGSVKMIVADYGFVQLDAFSCRHQLRIITHLRAQFWNWVWALSNTKISPWQLAWIKVVMSWLPLHIQSSSKFSNCQIKTLLRVEQRKTPRKSVSNPVYKLSSQMCQYWWLVSAGKFIPLNKAIVSYKRF